MKRSLPVWIMSMLISVSLSAQINPYNGIYDLDSCHFETPCSWILIHNDTDNIWQIGTPQKPFFDTAYSPANALVTDTVHAYASSNSSFFDIPVPTDLVYTNLILSFKHRFQTDSLSDGGYIEISYDEGATWRNVIQDTLMPFAFNSENLYTSSDMLLGGVNGFSGTSDGWITTRIQWIWGMPAKGTESEITIRFHFISDSVQTNKAGWMIDNILLSQANIPGGISDLHYSGISIKIAPNPADYFINLSMEEQKAPGPYTLTVFNVLGQEVKTARDIRPGKLRLDVSDLKSGMYFVQLKKEGQIAGSGKFLKR